MMLGYVLRIGEYVVRGREYGLLMDEQNILTHG